MSTRALIAILLLLAPFAAWANKRAKWIEEFVKEYRPNGKTRTLAGKECTKVLARARSFVRARIAYDGSYFPLPFPKGDPPSDRGVCTDIIVRGLRAVDVDLQEAVFRDMGASGARYPGLWGIGSRDPNIDHRRVPNVLVYLARNHGVLPITREPSDYLPCDIVSWDLGEGVTHIGIVSDRKEPSGAPAIIHHFGGGPGLPSEDDRLFLWRVIGHFAL